MKRYRTTLDGVDYFSVPETAPKPQPQPRPRPVRRPRIPLSQAEDYFRQLRFAVDCTQEGQSKKGTL